MGSALELGLVVQAVHAQANCTSAVGGCPAVHCQVIGCELRLPAQVQGIGHAAAHGIQDAVVAQVYMALVGCQARLGGVCIVDIALDVNPVGHLARGDINGGIGAELDIVCSIAAYGLADSIGVRVLGADINFQFISL
uniref:Uncharacterized protein n=1 Tax=Panagrolaimus superbus TaxID=310955 RepID=A0A914YAU2_9BILA